MKNLWIYIFIAGLILFPSPVSAQYSGSGIAVAQAADEADPGDAVSLSVRVRNNGAWDLSYNCQLWFKVKGPDTDVWAGYADCGGQRAYSNKKYTVKWTVPFDAKPGSYTYYARAYQYGGGEVYTPLGDWSAGDSFQVVRGFAAVEMQKVRDSVPGETVTLSADVKSVGDVPLGQGCEVWFKVYGPGLDAWAGYSDCSGLSEDSEKRYSINWVVPVTSSEGSYAAGARVYQHIGNSYFELGDWSQFRSFTIQHGRARVSSLEKLGDQVQGGKATLKAKIKNTGEVRLGQGCEVRFRIEGPAFWTWAGLSSCNGLAAGSTKEYSVDYFFPQFALPGRYFYRAQVYEHSGTEYVPISPLSDGVEFRVVLINATTTSITLHTTTSSTVQNRRFDVSINNFAYDPGELNVSAGDTVVWTNHDSVQHTVSSDNGNELGSALLSTGDSYSHTFDSRGTFDYHCNVHSFMHGKVVVV